MVGNLTWVKSSHSGGQGGNCVEVAQPTADTVAVRDSKNPDGPELTFSAREWREFTRCSQAGNSR